MGRASGLRRLGGASWAQTWTSTSHSEPGWVDGEAVHATRGRGPSLDRSAVPCATLTVMEPVFNKYGVFYEPATGCRDRGRRRL